MPKIAVVVLMNPGRGSANTLELHLGLSLEKRAEGDRVRENEGTALRPTDRMASWELRAQLALDFSTMEFLRL